MEEFKFEAKPPYKAEDLTVGDMVRFDGSRHVMVVTGIVRSRPKAPYSATEVSTGKKFKFGPHNRPIKIGRMDNLAGLEAVEKQNLERKAARRANNGLEDAWIVRDSCPEGSLDRRRWDHLLSLKQGDKVRIAARGGEDYVAFDMFLPMSGRSRFAFVATRSDGKRFKYLLGCVVLPEVK